MKSHNLSASIQAVITDPAGNVLKSLPPAPAHSLLIQFLQALYVQCSQSYADIRKTNGALETVGSSAHMFATNVTSDKDSGIVIGTGETAVTMLDYKLQSQAVNNVAYEPHNFVIETPDTSTMRLAISRQFKNNTGATLSIKEVGLYSRLYDYGQYACMDRTLYAVDVPSGTTITLTYRITIAL